jgi:anaphase-promoting complex subunit 2
MEILLINLLDDFDKNNSIKVDINEDQKISMNWLELLINTSNKFLKLSISTEESNLNNLQFQYNSWPLNKTHLNIIINKRYGDFLKKSLKDTIIILFKGWRNQDQFTKNEIIQLLISMYELGWTSLYYRDYMNVFLQEIDKHVHDICRGEFDTIKIPELQKWIEIELLPFACQTLVINSKDINIDTKYQVLKDSLSQSLFESYSRIRAKELFEIVADFPDSIVALGELKEAAIISGLLGHVGKVFRNIVRKRLLHSGAATSQILDIYVLMIRSLRVLDPSDLLLNFVAAPVRAYLMLRKDTVRSIVSSLTEGKDSELHGELRKGGSLEYGADEDDEDDGPGINWKPRKRDPDLIEVGARGLDVLALLVSIYGSTDLFVSEYRNLLADKILSNLEYDADHEVSTLELLKIRFGEESLHSCEVMLRDLEDSRRINNSITSELLKSKSVSICNF